MGVDQVLHERTRNLNEVRVGGDLQKAWCAQRSARTSARASAKVACGLVYPGGLPNGWDGTVLELRVGAEWSCPAWVGLPLVW